METVSQEKTLYKKSGLHRASVLGRELEMSETHLDRMSFVRGRQAGMEGGKEAGRSVPGCVDKRSIRRGTEEEEKTHCSGYNKSCLSVQH